jgi:hypothetical protein
MVAIMSAGSKSRLRAAAHRKKVLHDDLVKLIRHAVYQHVRRNQRRLVTNRVISHEAIIAWVREGFPDCAESIIREAVDREFEHWQ